MVHISIIDGVLERDLAIIIDFVKCISVRASFENILFCRFLESLKTICSLFVSSGFVKKRELSKLRKKVNLELFNGFSHYWIGLN